MLTEVLDNRRMEFLESGGALRCLFTGRLDGTVCSEIEPDLYRRIAEFRRENAVAELIFDLAGVNYISSAFLRICLIHCKSIGKSRFSVVGTSEEIHKVFHISGFSEIMRVSPLSLSEECLC